MQPFPSSPSHILPNETRKPKKSGLGTRQRRCPPTFCFDEVSVVCRTSSGLKYLRSCGKARNATCLQCAKNTFYSVHYNGTKIAAATLYAPHESPYRSAVPAFSSLSSDARRCCSDGRRAAVRPDAPGPGAVRISEELQRETECQRVKYISSVGESVLYYNASGKERHHSTATYLFSTFVLAH